MNLNDLTTLQKKYLRLLLYSHVYHSGPINAELIANKTNRHVSTVRRHIQSLVHMHLAESIPGPNGGYEPTAAGYNLLGFDNNLESKNAELQYNGDHTEIAVVDFNITNVQDMSTCRMEIYTNNDISQFSNGGYIEIDIPTDQGLHIKGEIDMLNSVTNQLLVDVDVLSTLTE